MILNRQNKAKVDLAGARAFAARLRQALELGRRDFNVCFVDDAAIRELNGAFRSKPYATDVLSFAWGSEIPRSRRNKHSGSGRKAASERALRSPSAQAPDADFDGFLGDVVISVETARNNARRERHAAGTEIRWLMLHGLLHLLGMDHETDQGEMQSLELDLRARLGLDGNAPGNRRDGGGSRRRSPISRPRRQGTSTSASPRSGRE